MPSKDKETIDKETVLDRATLKMVEVYRKLRDIYKAAEKARIPRARAVKVFNSPAFQNELERQEEAVRMERARQEVRDEKLTNEVIDRELLKVILLEVEKYGSLKLEGIRLGAVMTGRIQAGNTKSLESPGAPANNAGGFSYHALVQVQEAAPILPIDQDLSMEAPNANPPATPVAAVAAAAVVSVPAQKPTQAPATPKVTPAPKPAPGGAIRLG